MLQNKAYAAYANNKIMTASPAELTLMLYDEQSNFAILQSWQWRRRISSRLTQTSARLSVS